MQKSFNINECIERMKKNDVDAIIDASNSEVPILQLNSVLFGVRYGIGHDDYIKKLKSFTDSDESFFGVPLKCYATAALDLLKIQRYDGQDETIRRLIQSKMNF